MLASDDALTVSIHAPRAESDALIRELEQCKDVSIHAPRAESDDLTH